MNYGIVEMVQPEMEAIEVAYGLSLNKLDDLPVLADLFYEKSLDNGIEWLIDGTMYIFWKAINSTETPERSCHILKVLDAQYRCARTGIRTSPKNLRSLFARAEKAWKSHSEHVLVHILSTCARLSLPVDSLSLQEFFSVTAISQMLVETEEFEDDWNYAGDIGFKFDTAIYLYGECMRFRSASSCRIVRRSCMEMWEADHNPPTCTDMTETEQKRQIARGYMVEQINKVLQKARW